MGNKKNNNLLYKMTMSKLSTTLVIGLPIISLSLINAKLQKLKNEGKLTSTYAFLKTAPVVLKNMGRMIIGKKIKKKYYLKRLGNGTMNINKIKRLADHWKCRETDVICAIPEKSGTTWAQQICQQLRVGGDTNVNYNQDLLDVQPWIEVKLFHHFAPNDDLAIPHDPAAGPGAYDMDADHVDSSIRVFKSHLSWKQLEGLNCKKIYIYRNSVDQIYSGYRFKCAAIRENASSITPHQYATMEIFMHGALEKGLQNLCDFWDHRHDPQIAFFFFDDIKEDHAGSVERIAQLMGIENATPDLIQTVVEQSTVRFMSSEDHHLRFDGITTISNVKRALGLDYSKWPAVSGQPPRGKLRNVKVNKNGGLSSTSSKQRSKVEDGRSEVEACFRKTWDRIVLPKTGFANPEEMRQAWKLERSKLH